MNEIQANKPIDELKNADPSIKMYILQLENVLQNILLLDKRNKELEKTCLDLQEELFALKLQKEENYMIAELHKREMQQLRVENERVKWENNQLKVEVSSLRKNRDNSVADSNRSSSSSSVTKSLENKCNKAQSLISKNASGNADEQADANSVLIKGISENQLNKDPKVNIIMLARNMKLSISKTDIEKVYTKERKFYERHNLKPKETILIAQFKTPELKVEFLKNKEKLKPLSNTKDIEITDYVSDDVYNLYQYAKILKSHGYVSVYWRNNCVYAKKSRSSYCEPILIKCTKEVDVLKAIK